jgi:hypothetical protein
VPNAGEPLAAKGSTIRATLEFVAAAAGDATRDAVLARLSAADRSRVDAVSATDDVAFDLWLRLSDATDAVLHADVPDWPERAGARTIESLGVQLYAGVVRNASPLAFATRSASLFRLCYHPGDMKVVETERIGERGGRMVLRLVGFEHSSRYFCRCQTGGLAKAVELAGGGRPRARHVRCALDGDAFCEWDLAWA